MLALGGAILYFVLLTRGTLADVPFGQMPEKPSTADYMRRLNYSLDWVLRKWLNEPGVALFYNGPSVAAQKQAQQVSIINAHDQSVTIDIDYDSHLPIRKTFTWRDPADRQKNEEGEI